MSRFLRMGAFPKSRKFFGCIDLRTGINPMSENECRGEPCVRPTAIVFEPMSEGEGTYIHFRT